MITQLSARNESIVWWLLSILWMAVIFAFSNQAHSGAITEVYLGALNVPVRKCGHMFEYAVLFLLYSKALRNGKHAYGKAFVLAALYALSDEWHQSFVAGRSSSLLDVGVDSIGAALALVFTHFASKLKRVQE